jgi:hypothetical protein
MTIVDAKAELLHVRLDTHGATEMSPVCLAVSLHFDLACREVPHEHLPVNRKLDGTVHSW